MVALARRSVDATGVKLSRDELGALAKELTAADDGEVDMLLLARTGLDDAGAKVLAQGIAKNSSCRKFYLNANSIGPAGVKALCEALVKHSAVECINLGGNPIGREGAAALTKLVVAHGGIKQLILDDCDLGPDALAQLEGVLTSHGDCGLGMLSLWNNRMPPDVRRRWEGLVQGHASLVSIDLPVPIVNMHMAAPNIAQDRG